MWAEEQLLKDFRDLLFEQMKKIDDNPEIFPDKMLAKGYQAGLLDAVNLFYRQVGRWEILFENEKDNWKEK